VGLVDTLVPAAWLGLWGAMRRYHRYEVEGFEHLAAPGAVLIAGYHARGYAVDLCMLSVEIRERLGYLPHAVFHEAIARLPVLRDVLRALGGVPGDGAVLSSAVARGEHVVVLPGGGREAFRSSCERYRVDWGERLGYLRLALRLGIPIVPVASAGADDLYLALNDGHRWGKRLGVPLKLPFWLAAGPTGPFPLSLPFPVRIRQLVGERIHLDREGAIDPRDEGALRRVHASVVARVQELLDRARRGGSAR